MTLGRYTEGQRADSNTPNLMENERRDHRDRTPRRPERRRGLVLARFGGPELPQHSTMRSEASLRPVAPPVWRSHKLAISGSINIRQTPVTREAGLDADTTNGRPAQPLSEHWHIHSGTAVLPKRNIQAANAVNSPMWEAHRVHRHLHHAGVSPPPFPNRRFVGDSSGGCTPGSQRWLAWSRSRVVPQQPEIPARRHPRPHRHRAPPSRPSPHNR